jgi:hypothetical protein
MGKHNSRQIYDQQHHLAREEEKEDRLAGVRRRPAPPGRRSTRGDGQEARGTPRPRRQRSLPRRRSFYGSGLWRGGEETEGGRRGGICRPWISPGKKRARKFHLPARARLSSRRHPRFARARAVRARPRRNEGRGACGASQEREGKMAAAALAPT